LTLKNKILVIEVYNIACITLPISVCRIRRCCVR